MCAGCFQNREQFLKLLNDTEDWLYEEGEDESKTVYNEKLAELKVVDCLLHTVYTNACTNRRTHAHTHTHTHARAHTHTHTCTCTPLKGLYLLLL